MRPSSARWGYSHVAPRLSVLPDYPKPLLFAHRGLSSRYPENSLAAFKAARDRGIPGIELDVHLTADGRLAVFHDDDTGRIPGPGPKGEILRIESQEWDRLRSLDIGAWKGAHFKGQAMPVLDEVFEELGGSLYFDIEIKSRTVEDRGLERLLASTLRRHSMASRCIVSSFNPFSLRRFKKIEAGIPAALIWTNRPELHWFLRRGEGRLVAAVDALKPERHLAQPILAGRAPSASSQARKPVIAWTVDSAEEGERLLGLGALGLVSNDPEIHLSAARSMTQRL